MTKSHRVIVTWNIQLCSSSFISTLQRIVGYSKHPKGPVLMYSLPVDCISVTLLPDPLAIVSHCILLNFIRRKLLRFQVV